MIISNFGTIGVIDSGVGGLTLLKEIYKKFPNEHYIYLADNLNMPYGNKSEIFIKRRLLELVEYLYTNFNVNLVILACNTASIVALEYLQSNSPVKVLGLEPLKLVNEDSVILCTKRASQGCCNSPCIPCGKLASIIEGNIFNREILKSKIKKVIEPLNIKQNNIILGCTHYELVADIFKQLLPNKNFILPCKEFVKLINLEHSNSETGEVFMLSTNPTKTYIDNLYKIFKN